MAPPKGGRGRSRGRGRGRGGRSIVPAGAPHVLHLTKAQEEHVGQLLAGTASAPPAINTAYSSKNSIGGKVLPRQPDAAVLANKNEELRLGFERQQQSVEYQKMQAGRHNLPALAAREELVRAVAGNDVTVVAGGTGCGKSTQVPQFALDEMLEGGRGAQAHIICTQPRRIAAVGVAERVAEERGEVCGRGSVGYVIRGESKRGADSRLIFCTTGVLLKMLEGDSELQHGSAGDGGLGPVSHVVIDEVHERSCDSDLLLILFRRLLLAQKQRPGSGQQSRLKLILMSATLNSSVFVEYFGGGLSVGVVEIEGRTFPVQRLYLSDAIERCGYACRPGAAGHWVRPEVTQAALSRDTGRGDADAAAAATTGGAAAAAVAGPAVGRNGAEPLLGMMQSHEGGQSVGHAIIAANREARLKKERNISANSASGAGSRVGGAVHAWCDSVGQQGMVAADASLRGVSRRTLDTLRVIDHGKCATNEALLVQLLRHVVQQQASSPGGSTSGGGGGGGAVLVFLPGAGEISDVLRALRSDNVLGQEGAFWLLPLHSELSTAEQKLVFRVPPPGVTKLVLATNIAEASITIGDVTTVVDTGTHKEMQYDPHTSMASLVEARISQANAKQRAGRAGRVRAGRCFHLFLSWEEQTMMAAHQLPEIQRCPLESTCLRIKACGIPGGLRSVLGQAPEPPSEHAIGHVLRVLHGLGLVQDMAPPTRDRDGGGAGQQQQQQEEEEADAEGGAEVEVLTAVGEALSTLPVDPRIGKLLLLGAACRCLTPTLILGAALATPRPLFVAPFAHREAAQAAKRSLDPWSDHMAALAAYRGWKEALASQGQGGQRRYAEEHFLSLESLRAIDTSIAQLRRQLLSLHLLPETTATTRTGSKAGARAGGGVDYDEHAANMALVRALLAAALWPNIATVALAHGKGKGGGGRKGGAKQKVEFRTVDAWSRKALRKTSTDSLNDRVVQIHPSSVLAGHVQQARLGALVVHEQQRGRAAAAAARSSSGGGGTNSTGSQQGPSSDSSAGGGGGGGGCAVFAIFLGRVKTSQVFIRDASIVSAWPLMLLAGSVARVVVEAPGVAEEEEEEGREHALQDSAQQCSSAPETTVIELDGWLRFAVPSAQQASLLLGLRARLTALLASQLRAGQQQKTQPQTTQQTQNQQDEAVLAVVASLIASGDCGGGGGGAADGGGGAAAVMDMAQPLPRGWEAVEDPASAVGRVYYRNALSNLTQRQRPTTPATAAATGASASSWGSQSSGHVGGPSQPKAAAAPKRLAPPMPVPEPVLDLTAAEQEARAEEEAARVRAAAESRAKAAQVAAAEEQAARKAALQLVQAQQAMDARAREAGGVSRVSVAQLLGGLGLEHYAEGFSSAGVDDTALAEIIALVNDDAEAGAAEVEQLITDAGVRGGAAVKLRRALCAPADAAQGGAGGGRGGKGGGGGRKLSKKDKALALAAEKKEAAAQKKLEKARAAQQAVLRQAQAAAGSKGGGGTKKPAAAPTGVVVSMSCADLSESDGPKLVAKVVGAALDLPATVLAEGLPKDVLVLAKQKVPDVDVEGLAPKAALLVLGRAIASAAAAAAR